MTTAALRLAFVCVFAASGVRAAETGTATPISGIKKDSPTAQDVESRVAALSESLTPAQIKAALADGERMSEELKTLASAALAALEKPLPKEGPNVTSAARIEELRKKLIPECRKTVKVDSLLDAKNFALQPAAFVAYQACRAATTKSMASCDALASLAYTGKSATDGVTTPQAECRQTAGEQILVGAIITGNAGACSGANDFFSGVDAAKRGPLCQALVAGDCARAGAVAGLDAAGKAECRALTALRNAQSAQACAAPALPKNMQAACRSHFGSAGGCSAHADKIADEHCGPVVRDRLVLMGPEIKAQEAAGGKDNARTVAMKAFTDKRAEVDAVLFKVSEALRTTPNRDAAYKANHARLQKAIASVATTLKDFKTASGK